jgi:ribonucleoside-diphosphate reductase alpha chain
MITTGFLQRSVGEDERRRIAVNAEEARGAGACPRCGAAALIMEEGCLRCRDCGYSKCG